MEFWKGPMAKRRARSLMNNVLYSQVDSQRTCPFSSDVSMLCCMCCPILIIPVQMRRLAMNGTRSAFILHYLECMITSSSFPPQREAEYPLTTHQFILFSSLNGLRNTHNRSTVAKGTRPLLFRSTTIIPRASTFTRFHPSFTLNSRLPTLRPSQIGGANRSWACHFQCWSSLDSISLMGNEYLLSSPLTTHSSLPRSPYD